MLRRIILDYLKMFICYNTYNLSPKKNVFALIILFTYNVYVTIAI